MKKSLLLTVLFSLLLSLSSAAPVLAESKELLEGIDLYKQEAYAAAVEKLKEAQAVETDSGTAAFFLGMAYKQLGELPKSADAFRRAVTGELKVKEALVELTNVLIVMGAKKNLEEAETWIAVAEKENIQPAKIAFLKGMLLAKQGKSEAAIQSFEKSKALDESYTQSAEYQIAMLHILDKNYDQAQSHLRSVTLYDPNSTLASYARQYQDSVKDRMDNVFRFRLGLFGLYDDNLLLRWEDEDGAPPWPGGIPDTPGMGGTFRVDWAPVMPGNWLWNTQASFAGALYKENSTGSDTLSSGIYTAPGYNFGKFAANLVLNYNYAMKKRPSYEESSQYFSAGPMARWVVKANQLLELFAGYDKKEFALAGFQEDSDRDSDSLRVYLSWVYSHDSGAFLNLRYTFTNEDAHGAWYDNIAHGGLVNGSYPFTEKLNLQINGEVTGKDYKEAGPDPRVVGGTAVTNMTERRDTIYKGGISLNYELVKGLLAIVNYAYTYQDSNVAVYHYQRNIVSAGLEYAF